MKLYVARHGPAGKSLVDPKAERERSLTPQGRKVVQAIADAMLDSGDVPKVIFCSPFARTTETADIYGNTFGVSVNIVGDFSPDRPIEDAILEFMKHNELKRFMICVHRDNTKPAFDKFGGSMGKWRDKKADTDQLGDDEFWPDLVMGEARKLDIHRDFGYWTCLLRLRPSDFGYEDLIG